MASITDLRNAHDERTDERMAEKFEAAAAAAHAAGRDDEADRLQNRADGYRARLGNP